MRADVDIKGLRNLDRTLRALPSRVRKRILGAASLEMAKVARKTARRLHRPNVRTGRLLRSIIAKRARVRGPDGESRSGAVLRAGAGWARHAHLVEFGTLNPDGSRRSRAFPFMRPALNRHHGRMLRAARGRIRRLLPRVIAAAQRGG